MRTMHYVSVAAVLVGITCWTPVVSAADDVFGPQATWSIPTYKDVRTKVLDWAKNLEDEKSRSKVEALWPEEGGELASSGMLDRLGETFSLANENARELVKLCSEPYSDAVLPDFPWLLDAKTDAFVRNNMRLYYARYLAHQDLYDESLLFVVELKPEDVVDPAALMFYQCVAHHCLVNAAESKKLATRLLEREEELPRRFQQITSLLSRDLAGLKGPDTLDHIARRMADIRRRLDKGRAGKKVRTIEDGVVASLDKLIKELEKKQGGGGGGGGGGAGQGPGGQGSPMQDSQIARQKGPGNVQQRDVGSESGWGDLPPKEREEALQQIGQEFPSHYRDAIEAYFKKIASEGEDAEGER